MTKCLATALKQTTQRPFRNLLSTAAGASSVTTSSVILNAKKHLGPLHLTAATFINGNLGGTVGCHALVKSPATGVSSSNCPNNHGSYGSYAMHQKRCLFDKRKRKKKHKRKKINDPFKILGVKENMPYKDVKRAFLLIAMENHPDTAAHKAATEEELNQMRELFISARTAFESLTECTREGVAIRKSDVEDDEMDNFDSWFKSETGFDTPFQFDMDPETMKVCVFDMFTSLRTARSRCCRSA